MSTGDLRKEHDQAIADCAHVDHHAWVARIKTIVRTERVERETRQREREPDDQEQP